MIDYASLDVRNVYLLSSTMAAGLTAGAEIVHFRWTNTVSKVLVPRIRLSAVIDGTAFTAGYGQFTLARASGWTVDGTGGQLATLTNDGTKADAGISGQVLPGVRTSTIAALGGGTKTVNSPNGASGGVAGVTFGVPATDVSGLLLPAYDLWSDNAMVLRPLAFSANEGFVIRATVPATGTWRFGVEISWCPI